jgi:sialate O-acetylesterase
MPCGIYKRTKFRQKSSVTNSFFAMKQIFNLIALALLFCANGTMANIKLPAIFSDNMVLQQKSKVKIWGWADAGEKITITTSWNKKNSSITATDSGKWIIDLVTPKAGGPFTILLAGKNKIELKNVLIGEVWICSGQSNMHFPLGKFGDAKDWRTGILNYEKEIKEANYPKIRLFTVERKVSDTIQTNTVGKWDECNPVTIADFSAVAYFYGRELYKKLEVPIGLISVNYGGTPAEAWTRKEILTDTLFQPILDRYQYVKDNYPRLKEEYADTLAKWKKAVADSLLTPRQAQNPPRPPVGRGSNKAPYVLYNAMIAPLIPYTINGVIWYQGENNADRAWQYRYLFPAMIKNWRTDWNQGNFPFYFVQIAPHRSQNPEIREAQLFTYRSVPNTGMAIITDAGDSVNIHPINKQVVGYRLSLWALANTYGVKNIVYSGPIYKSMKIEGNKIRVFFDHVGSGLICKGDSLTHFTIAEANKKFVPAQAKIEGNTLVVWSNTINNPVSVRFAWEYIPSPNFYNKEGLPASPFRTDNWPEKTYGKK